ncbi:uncharacterized protein LOC112047575 [Bicyclus anynana]|uniref:Uncharacterized protein LOC112047575 n=1 Tax=Bicyclus anynana TaxID=110368 RepID=A0A6J1N0V7_BICAN|nr:uncharacterized protein LOC112047575 [Bicyclus anynana]
MGVLNLLVLGRISYENNLKIYLLVTQWLIIIIITSYIFGYKQLFYLAVVGCVCAQYDWGQQIEQKEEIPRFCHLDYEPGFCNAYFPRYYFSDRDNRCLEFIYGGCGGNSNRFRSVEACESTCLKKPDYFNNAPISYSSYNFWTDKKRSWGKLTDISGYEPILEPVKI